MRAPCFVSMHPISSNHPLAVANSAGGRYVALSIRCPNQWAPACATAAPPRSHPLVTSHLVCVWPVRCSSFACRQSPAVSRQSPVTSRLPPLTTPPWTPWTSRKELRSIQVAAAAAAIAVPASARAANATLTQRNANAFATSTFHLSSRPPFLIPSSSSVCPSKPSLDSTTVPSIVSALATIALSLWMVDTSTRLPECACATPRRGSPPPLPIADGKPTARLHAAPETPPNCGWEMPCANRHGPGELALPSSGLPCRTDWPILCESIVWRWRKDCRSRP